MVRLQLVALGAFAALVAVPAALAACGISAFGQATTSNDGGASDGGGPGDPTSDGGSTTDGGAADGAPSACFALEFDGTDDFVSVNDAPELDPTGPSTIEAWVWLKKDTAAELHVISHHDHFGAEGYLLMAFGYGKTATDPVDLGGCTRYYDGTLMHQVGFGGGSSMKLDRWVHLAATYDGTTLGIHVDGKRRQTKTGMPGHPNADFAGVLHIGRNALASNFAWGGLIDEVRISKVARYGIEDFKPATSFADDADTIALFHFDEGAGTTVNDVAGTHPGTINGATWVSTPCDER